MVQQKRMIYRIAYESYQACVRSLDHAVIAGEPPSQALLNEEAEAARELMEARAELLNALKTDGAGERLPV